MPAVATWTPEDAMLGFVAPLGLAVAAPGPALVVDLAEAGAGYFGSMTLRQLVDDGPSRAHLSPGRRGTAVLPNGGIGSSEAAPLVDHLVAGWPFVVLRIAANSGGRWPTVPVVPLLPITVAAPDGRVVYQDVGWRRQPPGPGAVLPLPRRSTWVALATGRRPVADRWLRALRQVWQWV